MDLGENWSCVWNKNSRCATATYASGAANVWTLSVWESSTYTWTLYPRHPATADHWQKLSTRPDRDLIWITMMLPVLAISHFSCKITSFLISQGFQFVAFLWHWCTEAPKSSFPSPGYGTASCLPTNPTSKWDTFFCFLLLLCLISPWQNPAAPLLFPNAVLPQPRVSRANSRLSSYRGETFWWPSGNGWLEGQQRKDRCFPLCSRPGPLTEGEEKYHQAGRLRRIPERRDFSISASEDQTADTLDTVLQTFDIFYLVS